MTNKGFPQGVGELDHDLPDATENIYKEVFTSEGSGIFNPTFSGDSKNKTKKSSFLQLTDPSIAESQSPKTLGRENATHSADVSNVREQYKVIQPPELPFIPNNYIRNEKIEKIVSIKPDTPEYSAPYEKAEKLFLKIPSIEGANPARKAIKAFEGQGFINPFNDREIVVEGLGVELKSLEGKIYLQHIRRVAPGISASIVLHKLIAQAKIHGVDIELYPKATPSHMGKGLTTTQLKQWYGRHGFTADKTGGMIWSHAKNISKSSPVPDLPTPEPPKFKPASISAANLESYKKVASAHHPDPEFLTNVQNAFGTDHPDYSTNITGFSNQPEYSSEPTRNAFLARRTPGYRWQAAGLDMYRSSSMAYMPGSLEVGVSIVHIPTNKEVGNMCREFSIDTNEVSHNNFELDLPHQKMGLGGAFYKNAEKHYKKMGIKRIDLYAASSVGGYMWATRDFKFSEFSTLPQKKMMRDHFKSRISKLQISPELKLKWGAMVNTLNDPIEFAHFNPTNTTKGQHLGKLWMLNGPGWAGEKYI